MAIDPVRLPFAISVNGETKHISEVESGLACACNCPNCGSPLIAAKGKKLQHHFKHSTDRECEGSLESGIHLGAKLVFLENRAISLPLYTEEISETDFTGAIHTKLVTVGKELTEVYFDELEEEKRLQGIIVDLYGKKNETGLIIEIHFKHKVDSDKLNKIKELNVSAVEIDLSKITSKETVTKEAFRAYVLNPSRVKWLFNSFAHQIKIPAARVELKISVQNIENQYAYEIRAKFEQEQQQKAELKSYLRVLDGFRSNASIEKYRSAIERDSLNKKIVIPQAHSLEDLPPYLKVDCADGDWIFGCDRRVWQAAVYNYITTIGTRSFPVEYVFYSLKNNNNIVPPDFLEKLEALSKAHPDELLNKSLPCPRSTIREYLNILVSMGLLRSTNNLSDKNCIYKGFEKEPNRLSVEV